MKTIVALLCGLLAAGTVHAQFTDSVHHHVKLASSGSINSTNTATAYLLNNNLRYGVEREKFRYNASAVWVYGQQNKLLTNNDFTAIADANLYPHDNRRLYYWALANYTTSYSLKINSQYQAGGGVAYSLIDKDSIYLNVSDGLLYEYSDLQPADTLREQYNTVRNSFRLLFRYKHRSWTFDGGGFLQNSLLDGDDYIIRTNASLEFKLIWGLSLKTAVVYNKFNRTDRENLLFTYGLVFEKFF